MCDLIREGIGNVKFIILFYFQHLIDFHHEYSRFFEFELRILKNMSYVLEWSEQI